MGVRREVKNDLIQTVVHLFFHPFAKPVVQCGPSALDQAVAEPDTLNGKRKAA